MKWANRIKSMEQRAAVRYANADHAARQQARWLAALDRFLAAVDPDQLQAVIDALLAYRQQDDDAKEGRGLWRWLDFLNVGHGFLPSQSR